MSAASSSAPASGALSNDRIAALIVERLGPWAAAVQWTPAQVQAFAREAAALEPDATQTMLGLGPSEHVLKAMLEQDGLTTTEAAVLARLLLRPDFHLERYLITTPDAAAILDVGEVTVMERRWDGYFPKAVDYKTGRRAGTIYHWMPHALWALVYNAKTAATRHYHDMRWPTRL